MADITPIIKLYQDLLIKQYIDKPKARADIALFCKLLLAGGVLLDVQNAYNLDTAVGKQLDILGKYAGTSRDFKTGTVVRSGVYFGFSGGTGVGLGTYGSPRAGRMQLYSDILVSHNKLEDGIFRDLIKLKIVQNYSNKSDASIVESLEQFFGNTIIVSDDREKKKITYLLTEQQQSILIWKEKEVFPTPDGIGEAFIHRRNSLFSMSDSYLPPSTRTGLGRYGAAQDGTLLSYGDYI